MNNYALNKLKLRLDIRNKAIYSYFKEQYGLVSIGYAKKVLGVGDHKFKKICKEYELEAIEMKSPNYSWNTKLYDINTIRQIKEEIDEKTTNP